jgi:hypothetical protein
MAWLTGWTYRKSITLSRASGEVTDYQMLVKVGESSGASDYDVHCEGHCKSNFSDLRFTADDATILSYWIEKVVGTTPNQTAHVWVKFGTIGTSATTFYMYYGKASATAVSSGANTFIVFDDFERGANGDAIGGAWTIIAGDVDISTEQAYGGTRSMKLIGGTTQPYVKITAAASDEVAVRFQFRKEATAYWEAKQGNASKSTYVWHDSYENIKYYDGATKDTGDDATADAWHLMEWRNFAWASGTFDIYLDGALIRSGATTYTSGSFVNVLQFSDVGAAGVDSYIDNVIVRNFRTTEPAWGSWGAETILRKRVMLWS